MKKTNIDSPFYRTMGKIGDLLFANLLWLVCCLPIVTAGASTLGLFTVVGVQCAFQQAQDYNLFLLRGQGAQIKAIRQRLGLTQKAYAAQLGVPLQKFKRWEQGNVQIFKSTWEKYFKQT